MTMNSIGDKNVGDTQESTKKTSGFMGDLAEKGKKIVAGAAFLTGLQMGGEINKQQDVNYTQETAGITQTIKNAKDQAGKLFAEINPFSPREATASTLDQIVVEIALQDGDFSQKDLTNLYKQFNDEKFNINPNDFEAKLALAKSYNLEGLLVKKDIGNTTTTVSDTNTTIPIDDKNINTDKQKSQAVSIISSYLLSQKPPKLGNIPDQIGTVGTAISTIHTGVYETRTNGDKITSYAYTGILPPGLAFDTTNGDISGIPTTAGTYNISITAIDNDGPSNADAVQFIIDTPPPTETPPTMGDVPDTTVQVGESFTVNVGNYVTGDGDPFTCNLTGTVPAGMTFDSTACTLTGSLSSAGVHDFSVTATDNDGISGSDSFRVTAEAPPPVDNPPTGENKTVDIPGIGANSASTTVTLTDPDSGDTVEAIYIGSGVLAGDIVISSASASGNTVGISVNQGTGSGYVDYKAIDNHGVESTTTYRVIFNNLDGN